MKPLSLKKKIGRRPILHILGKISRAIRAPNVGIYPRYATGRYDAYEKYGKSFFSSLPKHEYIGKKKKFYLTTTNDSHEGFGAVYIRSTTDAGAASVGHISLGYSKNILYIEAIQGGYGKRKEQDQVRQLLNEHWPNYLVTLAEKEAKKQGFKQVRIRVPESLYAYHYPSSAIYTPNASASEKRKTLIEHRTQMRTLYDTVATSMGYTRRGLVYIKKL
jgi:hypothetical protein